MISLMVRHRSSRDDAGAVAILVAVAMTGLLIAVAMVLDFGIVRVDRQMNKAAADSAVTAGLRGMDRGDGRPHPFAGVCQALTYLKLSQPELSNLPNTGGNVSCPESPTNLALPCLAGAPVAHYTATHGKFSVTIKSPYLLSEGGFVEEQSDTLQQDTGDPSLIGCDQIGVIVEETKRPGLGGLATASDLVSTIRSVGRVQIGEDGKGGVALLLLERTECDAVVINGVNSFVRVLPNGDVPGFIHADSDGTACSGGQRILVGDHAGGIIAKQSPTLPGVIRVRAIGTAQNVRGYDSTTNVVAEGGAPANGSLVTRAPIDTRYRTAVTAAIAQFQIQSAALYSHVFGCGATKAQLEAVPQNNPLTGVLNSIWVNCTSGSKTFGTNGVTFNTKTVYLNAEKVQANDLAFPNATRVYIAGSSGTAVNVSNTTFKMHHGTKTACGDTQTVSSTERARLIIGAGDLTANSGSSLMLCDTTVILRGGTLGGCVPLIDGVAPSTPTCAGRINLGSATDWTAPSTTPLEPANPAAAYADLEDLALWTEAAGSHDIGGGGAMRLSGVFFLPNGEFKVHGGSSQDVRNSQYVARKFRADGGSVLEMAPNPYDIVTIPIIGGFFLIR